MTYTMDKIATAYAAALGTDKEAATPMQMLQRRETALKFLSARKKAPKVDPTAARKAARTAWMGAKKYVV